MRLWPSLMIVLSFSMVAPLNAEPVNLTMPGQGFVANFWPAQDAKGKTAVLMLGGAEGGTPDQYARQAAKHGHSALALAYFGANGLPGNLDMIPLEYFDKPIQWLEKQGYADHGIVAIGGSKGAELALLLASRHPEITGVIAMAPSSVVWQGLPKVFWPPRSSWSIAGQPVPFVPYDISKGFDPNNLLALYAQSLTQTEAVKAAALEVEKIHGPVLLLSGQDDKLWPSSSMGDAICRRLQEHGFKYKYEHVKYENAGHTLTEYFMIGGTPEGNRQARLNVGKRIDTFLRAVDTQVKVNSATMPK